jgi:hypothetical protein
MRVANKLKTQLLYLRLRHDDRLVGQLKNILEAQI